MGGTVIGRVDCVSIAGGGPNGTQEIFTNLYAFMKRMEVATYATEIANNWGSGGTGFDFHDGGSPSGENAWAVFRMNVSAARPGGGSELGAYYVLIQYADGTSFGTAPGSPGKLNGSIGDGAGISVAFLEDGTSPWNGGTAKAGGDAKGTPVWVPGGSTLHVVDRANNPGGTYATNRENCIRALPDVVSSQQRFHMLGDEDSLLFFGDTGLGAAYDFYYVGIYEPLSYLTVSYPMVCIQDGQLPLDPAQLYGSTLGNTAREGGLTVADTIGPITGAFVVGFPGANLAAAGYNPNPQTGVSKYDELDVMVISNEAAPTPSYGWCGNVTFFGMSWGMPTHDSNAALDKAVFGWTVATDWKCIVPWGGASPPGTGMIRTGRDF